MPPTLWEMTVGALMDATNNLFLTILIFVLVAIFYLKMKSVGPALVIWTFSFMALGAGGVREPVSGMYFGFFIVGLAAIITQLYSSYQGGGG